MSEMVQVLNEGGACRIIPQGNVVASSVDGMRAEIRAALEPVSDPVVFDLSKVQELDSLGISLVVGLFKSCQQKNLAFSVEGVSPNLMRVFSLFKLQGYFPVKGA